MRRSRQVIAIVVLASALAADGALHAANANQQDVAGSSIASRLVQRISAGLRRTMAGSQLLTTGRLARTAASEQTFKCIRSQVAQATTSQLTPLQLHLPPPTV